MARCNGLNGYAECREQRAGLPVLVRVFRKGAGGGCSAHEWGAGAPAQGGHHPWEVFSPLAGGRGSLLGVRSGTSSFSWWVVSHRPLIPQGSEMSVFPHLLYLV